jgi:hypothetical protein
MLKRGLSAFRKKAATVTRKKLNQGFRAGRRFENGLSFGESGIAELKVQGIASSFFSRIGRKSNYELML